MQLGPVEREQSIWCTKQQIRKLRGHTAQWSDFRDKMGEHLTPVSRRLQYAWCRMITIYCEINLETIGKDAIAEQ